MKAIKIFTAAALISLVTLGATSVFAGDGINSYHPGYWSGSSYYPGPDTYEPNYTVYGGQYYNATDQSTVRNAINGREDYDKNRRDYDEKYKNYNKDQNRNKYRSGMYDVRNRNYQDRNWQDVYARDRIVSFNYDWNYYWRSRMYQKHPNFILNRERVFSAKQVIIRNEGDATHIIIIRNQNTGPYSVSQATMSVSNDFFNNLSSNLGQNQDLNLAVNTGNNTVSMNNHVGVVTTGNVYITIN